MPLNKFNLLNPETNCSCYVFNSQFKKTIHEYNSETIFLFVISDFFQFGQIMHLRNACTLFNDKKCFQSIFQGCIED